MCCTGLDVAAAAGPAVKAATGRTRPSRANRCLREGVTWIAPKQEALRGEAHRRVEQVYLID